LQSLLVFRFLLKRRIPQKQTKPRSLTLHKKAAVGAVNFRQGNAANLTHARADFTPDGWKDFMKHMEGFLDNFYPEDRSQQTASAHKKWAMYQLT
jgi:hypothetical protein